MILLTGASGFIGSAVLSYLNEKGRSDVVISDEFEKSTKFNNLFDKKFSEKIHRDQLESWLGKNPDIDCVIHIGARTDTAEFDLEVFKRLNISFSQMIWNYCSEKHIPLIYASSAATYGAGEFGYSDDHSLIPQLKPLNPYGDSKNIFDNWVLQQKTQPPFWAGLKFFNVYGPNEYHKGRMASVVYHAFQQIRETGEMKLFRSHHPDYKDGMQLRDFIYVKDIVAVIDWLADQQPASGIYNLGTGKARAFLHLAEATFEAMGKQSSISFIDTPQDIRDKYQYFTEADIHKLKNAGYTREFYSLEEGIQDYVTHYLISDQYY